MYLCDNAELRTAPGIAKMTASKNVNATSSDPYCNTRDRYATAIGKSDVPPASEKTIVRKNHFKVLFGLFLILTIVL